MKEAEFLAALRSLPLHRGASRLMDDTASLPPDLVLTKDLIVEGVHYLAGDPPGDVAWKLVAVNLSDLAAKGAVPEGVLLGYPLTGDSDWDRAFLTGFGQALERFACPLLGGDTVSLRPGTPRTLSLTAIGRSYLQPRRDRARPGDQLWVTGTVGDAGAGLAMARAGDTRPDALLARYRRPQPRLTEGRALAPVVRAMMDVSDGVLIDAARMATASGCAVRIALDALPLSADLIGQMGDSRDSRFFAATAGDDYELLFAISEERAVPSVAATRIGAFEPGAGLVVTWHGEIQPLPAVLGFQHGD